MANGTFYGVRIASVRSEAVHSLDRPTALCTNNKRRSGRFPLARFRESFALPAVPCFRKARQGIRKVLPGICSVEYVAGWVRMQSTRLEEDERSGLRDFPSSEVPCRWTHGGIWLGNWVYLHKRRVGMFVIGTQRCNHTEYQGRNEVRATGRGRDSEQQLASERRVMGGTSSGVVVIGAWCRDAS